MTAFEQFVAVQERAAALVQADPYFAGIEVLAERRGDVNQKIQAALQKLGLCVIVMTPSFRIQAKVRTRTIIRVRVVVECSEIVLTNSSASGTQKPTLSAAWAAALALRGQDNGAAGEGEDARLLTLQQTFEISEDDDPVRLVPDPRLLTYHATLFTDVAI